MSFVTKGGLIFTLIGFSIAVISNKSQASPMGDTPYSAKLQCLAGNAMNGRAPRVSVTSFHDYRNYNNRMHSSNNARQMVVDALNKAGIAGSMGYNNIPGGNINTLYLTGAITQINNSSRNSNKISVISSKKHVLSVGINMQLMNANANIPVGGVSYVKRIKSNQDLLSMSTLAKLNPFASDQAKNKSPVPINIAVRTVIEKAVLDTLSQYYGTNTAMFCGNSRMTNTNMTNSRNYNNSYNYTGAIPNQTIGNNYPTTGQYYNNQYGTNSNNGYYGQNRGAMYNPPQYNGNNSNFLYRPAPRQGVMPAYPANNQQNNYYQNNSYNNYQQMTPILQQNMPPMGGSYIPGQYSSSMPNKY